jgi:hypothetical protein
MGKARERKRKEWCASTLTPLWYSYGGCSTVGREEIAAQRAPERGGDGGGGGGSGARVCSRGGGYGLRKARAGVGALNRSSGGSWACGPEVDCGGDSTGED